MKFKVERIIQSKLFRNMNWLIFQNIYSMILSVVITAISARYLGPSNYGLLGYGASLVSIFASASTLGLDTILVYEIVVNEKKKGEIIGTALIMKLVASIISIFMILLFTFLLEPQNKVLLVVTFLQSLALIFQTYMLLSEWFVAELKSKYFVLGSIVGLTLGGGWKVLLLFMGSGVEWFALATSIEAIACGITVFCIFKRKKNFALSYSFPTVKMLLKKGGSYIIANIAIMIYMQTDKIMIEKMLGEYDVGIYTAAVNIANMWIFIPMAIVNSLRPVILKKWNEDYRKSMKMLWKLLGGIIALCFMACVVLCLFSGIIVHVLYGKTYLEAVEMINVLTWSVLFAMIGVVGSIWLIAENKDKYSTYRTIVGAVINVIFNYYAINKYGAMGAAYGTLVSQFVVAVVAPLFWKNSLRCKER